MADDLRDLDAEVHRKIFGRPVKTDRFGHHWTDEAGLLGLNPVPKYSTEVSAAWGVVAALTADPRVYCEVSVKGGETEAWFSRLAAGDPGAWATAAVRDASAARAICTAALQACALIGMREAR
jgi:hypothetical protein